LIQNLVDGLKNFSGGVGFRLGDLWFDYAFLPQGDLGQSHQVSLRYQSRKKANRVAKGGKSSSAVVQPGAGNTSVMGLGPNGIASDNAMSSSSMVPSSGSAEGPLTGTITGATNPSVAISAGSSLLPGDQGAASAIEALGGRSGVSGPVTARGGTGLVAGLAQGPPPAMSGAEPDAMEAFGLEVRRADDLSSGHGSTAEARRSLVEKLQRRIESDPSDAQAWLEFGHMSWAMDEKELAFQCFEQVIRLRPQERALMEWLSQAKKNPVSQGLKSSNPVRTE
jgi:hypothetical protein